MLLHTHFFGLRLKTEGAYRITLVRGYVRTYVGTYVTQDPGNRSNDFSEILHEVGG